MTDKKYGKKAINEIGSGHEHGMSHKSLHEIEGGVHQTHHDHLRAREKKIV